LCQSASATVRAGQPERPPPITQPYAAVIKLSGPWWIGPIEEVPGVNCQERTRAELLETLEVTLREALELNRREGLDAAGDTFEEARLHMKRQVLQREKVGV
jgi:predicted RNase H-like HicB family nuclease